MAISAYPIRCDGVSRRDFIRVGGLTALGLTVGGWLRARGAESTKFAANRRARSCILIWLDGGPSHLETFDLKPDAPAEVRGPFRPIDTAASGVQICELLPQTARKMNHVAIIRSLTSPLGEHNLGAHYMLTGYRPSPVLTYPVFGSVVAHTRQAADVLPPFIAIPDHRVGGGKDAAHGFLPRSTGPFEAGRDTGNGFHVPYLDYYPGLNSRRLDQRRSYLETLDRFSGLVDSHQGNSSDPILDQAYRLITSSEAKKAFDIGDEPAKVRQRYGPRPIGQGCLLARRLVERGVPFVTVNNPGWDTHQQLITSLRDGFTGAKDPVGLVPSLDLAFSALIQDLEDRRLLDDTLVVVMGEFGRTPKINTMAGRDHWPRVFSVAVAGGGVVGGQAIGSSDSVGESPQDRPITPADLACTVFSLLGVDPAHVLHTGDGRPVRVNQDGKLISELMRS